MSDKEKNDFDKLFDELFKNDKQEDKNNDDMGSEVSDKDFLDRLFNDDAAPQSQTEVQKIEPKEEKKDDDNFDWLKDLIDEIDKEEQEKKKTAQPTALQTPVKPKFTSKLKDKPRPPKPPEHIAKWGLGQKTVVMPVKDEYETSPRMAQKNLGRIKLHLLYLSVLSLLVAGGIFYYIKFGSQSACHGSHVVMRNVYSGDKILLDIDEISEGGKEVIEQGYVDAHISNLMYSLIKPGEKVIDVGAGFGYYTLYLARIVGGQGKVYSFEARKSVFELLDSSIQINRFHNVQTFNKVLFSSNTRVLLDTHDSQKRSKFGVANIILEQENIYTNYDGAEIVESSTLDSILKGVSDVSMLHINAHGSELSIILGARHLISLSPRIKIVTSWSKHQMAKYVNIQNVVAQMLDNGFNFWLIKPSSGKLVPLTSIDNIMQVERGRILIAKTLK